MPGRIRIDSRDFVVCWMRARSKQDVIKGMNLSIQQVNSKAKYLKDKGVRLPKLNLHPDFDELEVAQLNSLIKKMEKDNGQ